MAHRSSVNKNPYDPIAYPSLFFRRVGEVDRNTNLEGFAKKVNEKYRINKAVHEFNKAVIENDYYLHIGHIMNGGSYPYTRESRSRKNLSSSAQESRPYSAKPNLSPSITKTSKSDSKSKRATTATSNRRKKTKNSKTITNFDDREAMTSAKKSTRGTERPKSKKRRRVKKSKKAKSEAPAITDAKQNDDEIEEVKNSQGTNLNIDIPIVVTDPQADDATYTELKDSMVKAIISNRLIKQDDIENFIEQVKDSNQVDPEKFDLLVLQVKQEIGDAEE